MWSGRCTRTGLLLVGTLALLSCGESEPAGIEIDLVGSETRSGDGVGFAFSGEEVTGDAPTITVRAGETVTVNLENLHGQFSKNVTSNHDFAVVPQLADIATLAATGALADEVLWESRTGQVQAGASSSVTFVPDEPGTYYYVCVLPGHAAAGMIGEFVVTE